MKAKAQIELDFSGGANSWFDLWHTHLDWDGEENKNWEKRKTFLVKLLRLYTQYKSALAKYPHDFQLWISINDDDCKQDAVYIHTQNPNADNFPIKIPGDKSITTKNNKLKEFLETCGFEIIRYKSIDGDIYYLFKSNTGINLD